MHRLVIFLALCALVKAQLQPYGGVGLNPGLNSAFGAGRYPGAGYNNQYYNPASATAPILSYSNERAPDGSYSFSFATGDGKQAQETGFQRNAFISPTGNQEGSQVVEGSYSYTTPEGQPIQVHYVADENGFRASGDHIPTTGAGVPPGGLAGSLPGALPGGLLGGIHGLGGAGYPGLNGRGPYNYGQNFNRNVYNHLRR